MIILHDRVSPTFRVADWIDASPRHRLSAESRSLLANITSWGLDVNQDSLLATGLQSRKAHARVGTSAQETACCQWRTWMDGFSIMNVGRKANDGHIHHGGKDG
jgi:hypothetical protein